MPCVRALSTRFMSGYASYLPCRSQRSGPGPMSCSWTHFAVLAWMPGVALKKEIKVKPNEALSKQKPRGIIAGGSRAVVCHSFDARGVCFSIRDSMRIAL